MRKVKILIINDYSINNEDAVGITLRNIFESSNELECMEIYHLEKKRTISSTIPSYRINSKALPIDFLFRKIINREPNDTEKNEVLTTRNNKNENIISLVRRCIKYFSESRIRIDQRQDYINKIEEFNPDYIYTIGDSVFSLKLCYLVSKKYNKPIVVHFMDNWMDTLYPNKSKFNFLTKLFQNLLEKVKKRSSAFLVVSEKMKRDLFANCNVPTFVLMNTSNCYLENLEKKDHRYIEISYIGGLHLNRWESLLEIEKVIKRISTKKNIRLNIYSNNQLSQEIIEKFDSKVTIFHKTLPHDKIIAAYEHTDILLHVESMLLETINYTKYSLSTKIPEYMSTGIPILYYGPDNIASYEYLSDNKIAIVTSEKDELESSIKSLLYDYELKSTITKNAKKIAEKEHSIESTQAILESVFELKTKEKV